MKKLSIFIAFAMLAALTMVSCNNKPKEPTQEEVQEMKQALADSVLAQIDAFAEEYIDASENGFHIHGFELTEKEKLVKPDYLLEPADVDKFVTKSQKVNALAVYIVELGVRELYDMPLEDTKESIAKLTIDLNYPFDMDQYDAKLPTSERRRKEYEKCKENGDVALFWQFHYAIVTEVSYILAQNPELFFSKISKEQCESYNQRWYAILDAIKTVAKYDEEMATLLEYVNKYQVASSYEEMKRVYSSVEASKQFRMANKDKYIARRNAMLQ